LCRLFEPAPQVLENIRTGPGKPLEHQKVQDAIKAGEKRLGLNGRVLVRKSGTEPLVRVMAEGDDEALVRQVVCDIAEAVRNASRA
jgi:phosphoglucosamine mutase